MTREDIADALILIAKTINIVSPYATRGDKTAHHIVRELALQTLNLSLFLPEDDPSRKELRDDFEKLFGKAPMFVPHPPIPKDLN